MLAGCCGYVVCFERGGGGANQQLQWLGRGLQWGGEFVIVLGAALLAVALPVWEWAGKRKRGKWTLAGVSNHWQGDIEAEE